MVVDLVVEWIILTPTHRTYFWLCFLLHVSLVKCLGYVSALQNKQKKTQNCSYLEKNTSFKALWCHIYDGRVWTTVQQTQNVTSHIHEHKQIGFFVTISHFVMRRGWIRLPCTLILWISVWGGKKKQKKNTKRKKNI